MDVPILKYSGDKPVPNRCLFHQGFHPLFDPKEVVKQSGRGAMHPFTREFFHPLDRTASSSAEAVERFMHDSRRFPPSAYEATSLLWKNDEWRQPSPAERAQMMGIPPEALTAVPGAAAVRRQKQNSLLGNGFHVFSVMAIFCLLPQMLEAKLARHVPCDEAFLLAERLQFSIWEPGRLGKMPGLLDSHALVAQLPGLPHLRLPEPSVAGTPTSPPPLRLGLFAGLRWLVSPPWYDDRGSGPAAATQARSRYHLQWSAWPTPPSGFQ